MQTKLRFPFVWALGLAQICSWGTLYYSFPQLAVAMGNDLGWDKSQIYGALTVGLLLAAVAAIPVGVAIDKGNGRSIMTGGSILAGGLFWMWSTVKTLRAFYVIFAGLGLLQAAVLYTAIFAVIARHCDKTKTRHYITTVTLWGGFASTAFVPLIEVMMNFLHWSEVLVVLGAINILVCSPIYWHLPHKDVLNKDEEPNDSAVINKGAGKWAFRQPVFWILLFSFVLHAIIGNALRFHLYPMYLDYGFSGEQAVILLALLGPAQVLGRFAINAFQSSSMERMGIAVTTIFPLSLIIMAQFQDMFSVQVLAILAYGAAAGVMTIVIGIAVPEFLTQESYGLINGMMNTPILIMRAFAPSIAAFSWAITGSYAGLMLSLMAAGVMMSLLFAIAFKLSTSRTKYNKTSFEKFHD